MAIAIQLAKIGHPLTSREGLRLVNSLIDTEEHQTMLKVFKIKNGLQWQEGDKIGKLSWGYWRNLIKRHRHEIEVKSGTKFALDRSHWSKKIFIKEMYRQIYSNIVDAGLGYYLETPIFMDKEGNEVHQSDAYGEACPIRVTHPDWILFGDEIGCNTNMRSDRNVGGTKLVVPKGTRGRKKAICTDHRFTLFPLIAATGEPVVYCLI